MGSVLMVLRTDARSAVGPRGYNWWGQGGVDPKLLLPVELRLAAPGLEPGSPALKAERIVNRLPPTDSGSKVWEPGAPFQVGGLPPESGMGIRTSSLFAERTDPSASRSLFPRARCEDPHTALYPTELLPVVRGGGTRTHDIRHPKQNGFLFGSQVVLRRQQVWEPGATTTVAVRRAAPFPRTDTLRLSPMSSVRASCRDPHGDGTRTHDLPLLRRLLYQLSYLTNDGGERTDTCRL